MDRNDSRSLLVDFDSPSQHRFERCSQLDLDSMSWRTSRLYLLHRFCMGKLERMDYQ